jgi:hypothetical protein
MRREWMEQFNQAHVYYEDPQSSGFDLFFVLLEFLIGVRSVYSKACTVFYPSDTEIMGLNPTWGMDLCIFSVCVDLYGRANPLAKEPNQSL